MDPWGSLETAAPFLCIDKKTKQATMNLALLGREIADATP